MFLEYILGGVIVILILIIAYQFWAGNSRQAGDSTDTIYYTLLMGYDSPLLLLSPVSGSKFSIVLSNQAAEKLLGTKSACLDFDDIFFFSYSNVKISDYISGIAPGSKEIINVRLKKSAGEQRFELIIQRLPVAGGIFVAINDKQDEEDLLLKLKESQYAFEMASETGSVGFFEYDVLKKVLTGSRQFFVNLGIGSYSDEISLNRLKELVSFVNYDEIRTKLEPVVAGEKNSCSVEMQLEQEHGTNSWLRLDVRVRSRDEQSQVSRLVGVVIDIEPQKRMSLKLEEFSRNFELIMHNSPDDIYAKDADYNFMWYSDSIAEEYGLTNHGDLIGKDDFYLHSEPLAQEFRSLEKVVIEDGRSIVNYEQSHYLADGSTKWVLATKVPLLNKDAVIVGLLGINKDITSYKKVLNALNESQRIQSLTTLTMGIAHEFNNAVNGIVGFSGILEKSANLTSSEKEYVAYILESAYYCEKTIRHMIDFVRHDQQHETIVDVHNLLEEIVNYLGLSVFGRVRLDLSLEASEYRVMGVSAQLESMFINLLVNAKEAVRESGNIRIETVNIPVAPNSGDMLNLQDVSTSELLQIKIIDDGVGISSLHKDKIFEPFFTTKKAGESMGVGLPAVLRIITEHHGLIVVDSELGQGSCFTLTLPAL